MTKNIMEVWLRLMGDAFRGVSDAQEAVRSLSEAPMTPDKLTLWTSRFMPSLMGTTQPEAVSDWMEDTWRMMGVVPRYRYLELLERHEQVRSRLERAESEIKKLRKATLTSAAEMPTQEAQKVLDMWEGMLQETLKIQADWIKGWGAGVDKSTSTKQNTEGTGQADNDEAETQSGKQSS